MRFEMPKPVLQQRIIRRRATALVMIASVLFASPATAVQQKRASFKIPDFAEPLLDISSAPVGSFSADTATPIGGAEQVHLHNLTLRAIGGFSAEMRDTHLVVSLANNSSSLSVERCQRYSKSQDSCVPIADIKAKQHPQFSDGRLYTAGNIEIGILSYKNICREAERCTILIPSFVQQAMSQGKSLTLPALVSVARLEKSIELLDGERGVRILKLTSFPSGLTPSQLGKVLRIDARHRGILKIDFERAHLRINLLAERGILAAAKGEVWSVIAGSHATKWSQTMTAEKMEQTQVCKGTPLATSDYFAVYRNCVVPLGTENAKSDPQAATLKLPVEIDGALLEKGNESSFKIWSATNGRLSIMSMQVADGKARIKSILERPFHGRRPTEAVVFSERIFRQTADGIYLLSEDGELKTSLPASTHPVYFGEDGLSLLLGHDDGGRKCALKHMESSNQKPSNWRETGFSFSCLKSRVASSRDALTVTKIDSGTVEIYVLGGN
jgi:hypothetical protein